MTCPHHPSELGLGRWLRPREEPWEATCSWAHRVSKHSNAGWQQRASRQASFLALAATEPRYSQAQSCLMPKVPDLEIQQCSARSHSTFSAILLPLIKCAPICGNEKARQDPDTNTPTRHTAAPRSHVRSPGHYVGSLLLVEKINGPPPSMVAGSCVWHRPMPVLWGSGGLTGQRAPMGKITPQKPVGSGYIS